MIHGFGGDNHVKEPFAARLPVEVEEAPLKRENEIQKRLYVLIIRGVLAVS
jgi:hypothetical protein